MAEKPTTTPAKEKAVPVFTKAELIESAHVLKTTPAILTGALYDIKKDNLTREEAERALSDFLKHPVKNGGK
ncbi:hypothetical protein [uncultured Robinsoniella sp.]|uniref:hypothetical protein n=1 Tax=uncultured Robinsoniella sp. TaxID=904190 RepID=UPI00374F4239